MKIDAKTCNGCGLCVDVCPAWIPYRIQEPGGQASAGLYAERLASCITCGQCMAVCPTQAIEIDGLSYERDIFQLPKDGLEAGAFFDFLTARRSTRLYQDKPVPHELLQKIVDAITLAPMGFTPHKVEVTVVESRAAIEQALPHILNLYASLAKMIKNPVTRFFFRRSVPAETYTSLCEHVLPGMAYRIPEMQAGRGDTFTRGAPALILFHARRDAASHSADANIALTYGLLAAQALGLGASGISLVPPAVEHSPELRRMFAIPPGNEVVASMILGYPRIHFKKGIRRELAGVHWVK